MSLPELTRTDRVGLKLTRADIGARFTDMVGLDMTGDDTA